jgi:hypothetical protein
VLLNAPNQRDACSSSHHPANIIDSAQRDQTAGPPARCRATTCVLDVLDDRAHMAAVRVAADGAVRSVMGWLAVKTLRGMPASAA